MLKGSFSFVKAVVPQHGARVAVAQRRVWGGHKDGAGGWLRWRHGERSWKKKLEFKVDPKTMGVFGCLPYPASEVWRRCTSGDENSHLSFGVFFHWKRL